VSVVLLLLVFASSSRLILDARPCALDYLRERVQKRAARNVHSPNRYLRRVQSRQQKQCCAGGEGGERSTHQSIPDKRMMESPNVIQRMAWKL